MSRPGTSSFIASRRPALRPALALRPAPRPAPRSALARAAVLAAVLLAGLVGAVAALVWAPAALAAVSERVSLTGGGVQGDYESGCPCISADGRYVAFVSAADNLVPGDTNGDYDVFVYDRQTHTIRRVSVATGGVQADGDSAAPAISGDGTCVAFLSRATNLVSDDTNGKWDVFVHVLGTGVTSRMSVGAGGAQADAGSTRVSLNGDGSLVCFTTAATNLVADDTNGVADVFLRDRTAGTTERVSVGAGGAEADRRSDVASPSGDGRYVAFDSVADNLVTGDTNGKWDVFVRDRQAGTTARVSAGSTGGQANGDSICPSLSADGGHVAFESEATNLVSDDTNGRWDVFVHDLSTGATARVSLNNAGTQGDDNSDSASVSADGRYVAFVSQATNLAPNDTNGMGDVFVRDRTLSTTQRVSVSSAGVQGYDDSDTPALSQEGGLVAFESWSGQLVGSDTNKCADVFVGQVTDVPTITGLSKSRASILGGTTVVITGTLLTHVSSVTFGGVAAASFTVDSASQITAVTPAHAEGAAPVQVMARGVPSDDTPADDFTYFPAILYQQTDPDLGYLGAWGGTASAAASGGNFWYAGSFGATVLVSFEGRDLTWVATTGPQYGQASVSLDDGDPTTVDLYAASVAYRQEVYDTGVLPDKPHTLAIKWTGDKNAAATGFLVSIDALKVTGTLTQAPAPTRCQEGDANLSYAGYWALAANGAASGGVFANAGSSGGTVNVSFKGTYLGWIARTGPQYGKASVSLDGGEAVTVDLYSPGFVYGQCVYNTGIITDTDHTLSISWTGTKRAASVGTLVDLDAVDVLGTLTAAPLPSPVLVTYQQNDPRLTYLSSWTSSGSRSASGGSFYYGSRKGCSVTACFQGTAIAVLAKTGPQYGVAKITLDGGPAQFKDFYSSRVHYRQNVYSVSGLAAGAHTLSIEWTGKKRAAARGNNISVDALQVVGVLTWAPKPVRYQQTDSHLVYSGTWGTGYSVSASARSFAFLGTPGSVTIKWTGTSVCWVTKTGPQYGVAKLTLDGGTPFYVDLYSAAAHQQQRFFVTGVLPNAGHTLVIEPNGTKRRVSSGYLIGLDAVDVVGTLQ